MPNYEQRVILTRKFLQRFLILTNKDLGFSSLYVDHNLNGIQISFELQYEMELDPIELQFRIIRLQKEAIKRLTTVFGFISADLMFEFRYNGTIIEYPSENDLELQEGYFFYPGGRFDYDPILKIIELSKINRFVYCDYDCNVGIELLAGDKFELIEEQEIGPDFLDNHLVNWEQYWHPEAVNNYQGPDNSFAKKFTYRYIQKNSIIELIYFKTEALGTYKLLCENWGVPAVLRLQDHGLGGYWTTFGGDNLFYQLAIGLNSFPKYILKPLDYAIQGIYDNVITQIWPGYARYFPIDRVWGGEMCNEFFIKHQMH